MVGALAEALPDRVAGRVGGHCSVMVAFGGKRADGSASSWASSSAAAAARRATATASTSSTPTARNCMNLPAEALEMDAPLRVQRVELRADSGGAGRHRGGLGVVREYEFLADDIRSPIAASAISRRPADRCGGGGGAVAARRSTAPTAATRSISKC